MPEAGRIITGSAGGIRLRAPGEGTRPLSDKVKQALFASLEAELEDPWSTPFLDLFAGSGAGGIEALSRGAPRAVFVEDDAGAARVIAENLRRARLEGGVVVRKDARRFLGSGAAGAGEAAGPFGVVLVDPPYADIAALASALTALGDASLGWVLDDAVVVATHFWRSPPPDAAGRLRAVRDRRFGETALRHYRVMQHEEAPAP
jgi:16S rRNA (guanine966-N2)-methyltransferase